MLTSPERRIPSLDGLRGISIGLVMFGHLCGTLGFPLSKTLALQFGVADLGVRVFFVISGFLITRLLLEESQEQGRIGIARFYLRRTLRICPPYYALIAILLLLDRAHVVTLTAGDVAHALTYTTNYQTSPSWNVGHAWSLAVEEQFYLLWPVLVALLGRAGGLRVALGCIAAAPFARLALWIAMPAGRPRLGMHFETAADAIAVGCVLALAVDWLHRCRPYQAMLASRWIALAPVLLVLSGVLGDRPRIDALAGVTLRNLLVGLCIDWCLTYPGGRVGRVLNAKPLTYVGVMSYSIYLWQQLFLNAGEAAPATSFPVNVVLVGLAALASYLLVERPARHLRQYVETHLLPSRPRLPASAGGASEPV
jgi:peptidoglycan/LPS O-acetylase OafA/YrhL